MRRATGIVNAVQMLVFAALALFFIWFCYLVAAVHHQTHQFWLLNKLPDADFTNVWAAGGILRAHQVAALYSSPLYHAWKVAALHHPFEVADWIYPPTILALAYALSAMPLWLAFPVWNIASWLGIAVVLRVARLPWCVVAVTMVSPAEYNCLFFGQFGGIVGALSFAGLLLAWERPVLGGVFLGLAAIKPQPGLIAPVVWLAARNWRAITAAGTVFIALAVFPLFWLGPDVWMFYITKAGKLAALIMQVPFGASYQQNGVSVYWMLRSLHASNHLAYGGQAVAAVAAMAMGYRAWRIPAADKTALAALAMFLSLLIVPYAFSMDMVGYTVALAALAQARGWRVTFLDGALWLWPGYIVVITGLTGVLLTPLALVLASWMAWRQLRGFAA